MPRSRYGFDTMKADESMKKTRVLLIDDHTIMRMGLISLLKTCKEIDVAGDASDGESGVRMALKLRPDVIVMDTLMPGMDGNEATRKILAKWPEAKVLVLTTLGTSDGFAQALGSGARGAVLKNANLPELRTAIAAVAEGGRYISGEIEQIMSDDPPLPHLSARQLEVLKLVARGFSNTEIAKIIGISAPVVNEHVMAVLAKIGAANRTEAVAIAIHKHLLKP